MDYSTRPIPFNARIVPKQTGGPLENGFGFIAEGRVFKWKTFDEALAGANCLGLDPWFEHIVVPVKVIFPNV